MANERRVLVVDDDLDVLYYVDDLLQELGYRPIKATSAEDAAEIVGAMRFDAAVIGMKIVGRATTEALEQLAARHNDVPLLVMAGAANRPDGDPSPLRRFLERPPDLSELESALESCLGAAAVRFVR